MKDRLGRALVLLQATPLPPDLIDDPAHTGQWMQTLGNLTQALAVLHGARHAAPSRGESRSERLIRIFNRMTDGLPLTCLANLSPVIKFGLLRPLLQDLEAVERRVSHVALPEAAGFSTRLALYRRAAAAMLARHSLPDELRVPPEVAVFRR